MHLLAVLHDKDLGRNGPEYELSSKRSPMSQSATVTWQDAFGRGFTAPWRGFVYLWQQPGLWLYGIVPVLLNLFISAFALAILVGAAVAFMMRLHPEFPEGWWGILLEIVAGLASLLVAGTLAFVVWFVLQSILLGHFLGLLAKHVEVRLGTPADRFRDIPWSYQVIDTFRDMGVLIAINAGAMLLHVIPLLGSVVSLGVMLYFNSMLFGAEVLDYPLMLRGMRRQEKWTFLRAHRPYTLGIGLATLLIGLVPLIGPIYMTAATVGGVLLYHELETQVP
jgi:CysZ protein